MEKKIYDALNKIRFSKAVKLATDICFPALIVLMALVKVNKGLDITDSSYSCTNFLFTDRLDGMWYYSTFYANLCGHFFASLPGGSTFIGLNAYTGLTKVLLALVAYYFFTKSVKVEKELVFLGVLVSVALCWCPTTILYNYLTYLLLFVGMMLLYRGLTEEKKGLLIAAGVALGSNFFVRLPNVVEAGIIIALWGYAIFTHKTFKQTLFETLWCMLGYVLAFIPGCILIACTRGFKAYFTGINELFGMTSESTSYSARAMVESIIRQYIQTWQWTETAVFMLLLCLLAFLVFPKGKTWLRYVCATIISCGFIILLYYKGLFPLNFHWFEPVYRYGAMLLTFIIVTFVIVVFRYKNTPEERLLALLGLLAIAITPIGSNNDIYSNLNNFFFVLPVFLYLIVRFINSKEYFRGVRYSLCILFAVYVLLSVKFGATYVFRDGLKEPMDTYVTNNPSMAHMKTTATNAKALTELNEIWQEKELSDRSTLLYGNVCGLGFYMDTPVALSTAWPSLASFSTDKFEKEMKALSLEVASGKVTPPSIVIGNEEFETWGTEEGTKKQEILNDFLEGFEYSEIYSNEVLTVYLPK